MMHSTAFTFFLFSAATYTSSSNVFLFPSNVPSVNLEDKSPFMKEALSTTTEQLMFMIRNAIRAESLTPAPAFHHSGNCRKTFDHLDFSLLHPTFNLQHAFELYGIEPSVYGETMDMQTSIQTICNKYLFIERLLNPALFLLDPIAGEYFPWMCVHALQERKPFVSNMKDILAFLNELPSDEDETVRLKSMVFRRLLAWDYRTTWYHFKLSLFTGPRSSNALLQVLQNEQLSSTEKALNMIFLYSRKPHCPIYPILNPIYDILTIHLKRSFDLEDNDEFDTKRKFEMAMKLNSYGMASLLLDFLQRYPQLINDLLMNKEYFAMIVKQLWSALDHPSYNLPINLITQTPPHLYPLLQFINLSVFFSADREHLFDNEDLTSIIPHFPDTVVAGLSGVNTSVLEARHIRQQHLDQVHRLKANLLSPNAFSGLSSAQLTAILSRNIYIFSHEHWASLPEIIFWDFLLSNRSVLVSLPSTHLSTAFMVNLPNLTVHQWQKYFYIISKGPKLKRKRSEID